MSATASPGDPAGQDPPASICYSPGQPMDPEGIAIRAIYDPGVFVDRRVAEHDGRVFATEPMHRWQAHAVVEALKLAGYQLEPLPGAHITTPRPHAEPVQADDEHEHA